MILWDTLYYFIFLCTLIDYYSTYDVNWSVNSETIEEILVANYLGVKIQLRGRNIIGQYEEIMIKRTMSYAYTILSLTRGGV